MSRRYLLFVTKPYSFAVLEPLQACIQEHGFGEVAWFTASLAERYPVPGRVLTTTGEVEAYNPDAVLVPGNAVPHFWPGLKVQVFHGLDDEVQGFYRLAGLFDLYCTPGPVSTRRFHVLAATHRYFLVEETGWPKLDPLASSRDIAAARQELGLNHEDPVVLYAPTFPPKYTSAPALWPAIRELTAGPYRWLIKFHPLMDAALQQAYRDLAGDYLQVVDGLSILPYMQAADLLVTDTSSVAYEFLLLNRPLVTYRATARLDKGLDISRPGELAGALHRSLDQPAEFMAQRQAYLNEVHPYTDGQSSRRVLETVDRVLDQGLHMKLHRKPLNLVRKWKIRRLVGR